MIRLRVEDHETRLLRKDIKAFIDDQLDLADLDGGYVVLLEVIPAER